MIVSSRRTCRKTIPVHHLVLNLTASSSAPSWNRPTGRGGDKSREVLGPCNITLLFIRTSPKEVIQKSVPLGIGCDSTRKQCLWNVLLTSGGKEDCELKHVGRGYIDARLWMHVPGFFDTHQSVERIFKKVVLRFQAVSMQT